MDDRADIRRETVRRVRLNAEDRDERADARDDVADLRDTAADLESFLHTEQYGDTFETRRAAATDRQDSKQDRVSAAADRAALSKDVPNPAEA